MSAFPQSFASFCIPSDCCLPVNVNLTHQDSISSTCPLRAALKGLDRRARKCGIVMHCCVFQRCLDSFCKNNKFVSWSDSSLMRISDQEKHDLPHILKWLHLTALVILCHSQTQTIRKVQSIADIQTLQFKKYKTCWISQALVGTNPQLLSWPTSTLHVAMQEIGSLLGSMAVGLFVNLWNLDFTKRTQHDISADPYYLQESVIKKFGTFCGGANAVAYSDAWGY